MENKLYKDKALIYYDNSVIKGWHTASMEEYLSYMEDAPEELPEQLHWVGAHIPADLFGRALALIKHFVHTEVMICLYYNKKEKKWIMDVPKQEGFGASVHYESSFIAPPGFLFCGTIHSHPQMKAFWSSTDRNDQCSKDGLHIVVGTDDKGELKEYLCSLWFHKQCYCAQDQVDIPETIPEADPDSVKLITESKPAEVYPKFELPDTAQLTRYAEASDSIDEDALNYYLFDDNTAEEKLSTAVWLLRDLGMDDIADKVEAEGTSIIHSDVDLYKVF